MGYDWLRQSTAAREARRLCQWARERGFDVDENRQGQLHVWRAGQHITIETEAIDVGEHAAGSGTC